MKQNWHGQKSLKLMKLHKALLARSQAKSAYGLGKYSVLHQDFHFILRREIASWLSAVCFHVYVDQNEEA